MKKMLSFVVFTIIALLSLYFIYNEAYTNGGVKYVYSEIKEDLTNIKDNSISQVSGVLSLEEDEPVKKIKLTEPKTQTFNVAQIEVRDTKDKVIDVLGKEKKVLENEYGSQWYEFHDEYENFVLVSFDSDNLVNGLFTNQDLVNSKDHVTIGTKKEDVKDLYGEPLKSIKKGNTNYIIPTEEDFLIYKIDNNYVTFFFDSLDENRLQAVQIVHEDLEKEKKTNYGAPSDALSESFERLLMDVTNATRVKHDLPALEFHKESAGTAKRHSQDMAENNFFSHENLRHETPFDRLAKDGIRYRLAGENLAMGQSSSLFAHLGLMNSEGHRKNILKREYEKMSVGVAFDREDAPYYTEIYITE